MKRFHNALTSFVTAVLVMLIGFSGISNPALAVAPSNSPLSISVTVTHSEDQEGQSADRQYFQVNLSPSPLQLTSPPDQMRLLGEEIIYPYTAVSTANGLDTYNLFLTQVLPQNTDGAPTAVLRDSNGGAISSLTLGVTAASGSVEAGVLEIPVPSDGVSDGSINGIGAGDTVVIHGQKHTVDVVEDETLEEISVIWLNEPHDSVINVGDLISESATFELVVSGVTIADLENDATVGILLTASSQTDTDQYIQDETLTTVYAPIPAETQYFVRNVTNPNGEGDPAYSTGDQSYYGTGGQMMASAGDELEYIIVQTAGNTGDLNNVVMTSTMPLFTTYMGNSTFLNGAPQADASDTAQSALIAGLDVGTIVRNGKAEVTFRVIVDDKGDKSEPKKEDQTSQDQGQQNIPDFALKGEYFHLKTLFRGDDECLEGNQFLPGNTAGGAAFMSPCTGQSGMFWKLVPSSQSGYFHLTTLFREKDNECLEGNEFLPGNTAGGAAFMSPCTGQSGMFWRLEKTSG